ncbi:hypothetical protein LWM68_06735 [Niabella sp. W65]|nr:hypothetical protein [Niabella sp. W65]MCH7362490.1 hypothetical protein [Niabella sp. W65]
MDSSRVNRVEIELNQWRSREERFSKLFSFNLSSNRALLKEKLDYYDRIAARYKGTQDLDERFALRVLRQERSRIEKQLYPNLLLRLLRRLLIAPLKEQIIIRQDNRKTEQNSQALHQQVQRTGFSDLSVKIDEQIRQGQQQFSIPVSYYLNDKERIDHQLSSQRINPGSIISKDIKQYCTMRQSRMKNASSILVCVMSIISILLKPTIYYQAGAFRTVAPGCSST